MCTIRIKKTSDKLPPQGKKVRAAKEAAKTVTSIVRMKKPQPPPPLPQPPPQPSMTTRKRSRSAKEQSRQKEDEEWRDEVKS